MSIQLEILPPSMRRIKPAVPRHMLNWISDFAQRAATLASVTKGSWVIHLVGDQHMIQYHKQTMNLATTTDVLTINYTDETINEAGLDLETIICVDEAQRQAQIRKHGQPELEMLLYAIHSLLHCIGYDDLTARQALRMHRKEDLILRKMGLPTVYFTSPETIKVTRHGPRTVPVTHEATHLPTAHGPTGRRKPLRRNSKEGQR